MVFLNVVSVQPIVKRVRVIDGQLNLLFLGGIVHDDGTVHYQGLRVELEETRQMDKEKLSIH